MKEKNIFHIVLKVIETTLLFTIIILSQLNCIKSTSGIIKIPLSMMLIIVIPNLLLLPFNKLMPLQSLLSFGLIFPLFLYTIGLNNISGSIYDCFNPNSSPLATIHGHNSLSLTGHIMLFLSIIEIIISLYLTFNEKINKIRKKNRQQNN